jgi:hypothetical protein
MPFGHSANINLQLSAQHGISTTKDFTVSYSGATTYCTPGSTGCSSDKFSIVQLLKKSDQTSLINNTSTTCTSGGYQNYLSTTATLLPGEEYTIKVRLSYANDNVKGWIDYNGNNSFDDNEVFVNAQCASTSTTYSYDFTVPQTAKSGTTRMRLRMKDGGEPGTCDGYTYGQTHDYTIEIPDIYPRVQNVVAELVGSGISVTWDAPTEGTPDGYNIYRSGNKLNEELLTATTFTENNIEQGIYAYNITAVYAGNKESFAEMSNVICHFITCDAPEDIDGQSMDYENAHITWSEPQNITSGRGLLGYNIFRDGNKVNGDDLIKETEYIDEELTSGTYHYQVSAVYDDDCESPRTMEVTVVIHIPEHCEAPRNVSVTAEENSSNAIITWEAPEIIDQELLGYNIYRNGNKINETPVEDTEFTDENVIDGNNDYQVSAVYGYCIESEKSEVFTFVGIKAVQTLSFSIFPNPATGHVTITGAGLNKVEIIDIQGRKLAEYNNIKETLQITDLKKYESGIYLIKMYSETKQIVTQRLTVVK